MDQKLVSLSFTDYADETDFYYSQKTQRNNATVVIYDNNSKIRLASERVNPSA